MMNTEANVRECELLQKQFEGKIRQATQDKIENGNYTKEGLRALVEAAMIQQKLKGLTTGAAAEGHRKEFLHLIKLARDEMERQGLIAKRPTPPPRPAAPAGSGAAPAAKAPGAAIPVGAEPARAAGAPKSDELPDGFSLDDYILKPTKLTLDDVKSNQDLVDSIHSAIYTIDVRTMFPNATREWDDEVQQPNFLFYGPPGTGKSHLCRAIAGTLDKLYPDGRSAMFLADAGKISSKYVGVTGKILRAIFQAAESYEFAVVCVDEIEGVCPSRADGENKANYTRNFLELIEGVCGRTKAMVIACTNYPWKVDSALLSRLNQRVFIDYPTREDIVSYWTSSKQRRDYFGDTPEEQDRLIGIAADLCVERRFSYRNINNANDLLRNRVIQKTQEAYPKGNAELEHMLPVTEDELRAFIEQTKSDYNPVEYQKYLAYNEVQ